MRIVTGAASVLALLLMSLGSQSSAYAVATLALSDGTTTVTVADGGAGDLNPNTGAVTFIGSVGVFTLNVTTGLTPAPGMNPLASMDLNTVNATTSGTGTLTIKFSQDGFTSPANYVGVMTAGPTITPGESVTYRAWADASNTLFGHGQEIAAVNYAAPGEFKIGTGSTVLPSTGPYSMTQELTFNYVNGGTVSGDFTLEAVPEPASIGMLGGVLLLTCGAIRRRIRKF